MAHVEDNFIAKPRVAGGKGAARQLRASGWIPAVAYGPNQQPRNLAVDPKSFLAARWEYGVAHVYDVNVEGESPFKALIKDVDRDPVSRKLKHIDLYALDMNKPVRLEVRVELTGKPKGAIKGGILQQAQRRVEVQCLPKDIPAKIVADISHLDLNESLHLSDLPLPEGVKTTAHEDEAVAVVSAPEGVVEAAAEGEGAETSAG